jgi:hypothetical protein
LLNALRISCSVIAKVFVKQKFEGANLTTPNLTLLAPVVTKYGILHIISP